MKLLASHTQESRQMDAMTVEQVKGWVKQGLTDGEIGAMVGRERRTVQTFRAKHGIKASGPVGQRGTCRKGRTAPPPHPDKKAPAAAPPKPNGKQISVAEFLLNKRRAVCPVCRLKEPVKSIVSDARKLGTRQQDIIECLQVCYKITVTPHDFSAHVSGRHEQ